jgi:hypothetical protein
MANDTFRIEWDLRELGPRETLQPVYRDISAALDFSRLDYARAVAAGYLPASERASANEPRFDHEAA